MRTIGRMGVVTGLILGLGTVPMIAWAAEHGGKEHGGSSTTTRIITDSTVQAPPGAAEADEASVMREAAAALRKGEVRPDLADKLEELAKEH